MPGKSKTDSLKRKLSQGAGGGFAGAAINAVNRKIRKATGQSPSSTSGSKSTTIESLIKALSRPRKRKK